MADLLPLLEWSRVTQRTLSARRYRGGKVTHSILFLHESFDYLRFPAANLHKIGAG